MNLNNKSKTTKFLLGLCFDALGYVSFIFPFLMYYGRHCPLI